MHDICTIATTHELRFALMLRFIFPNGAGGVNGRGWRATLARTPARGTQTRIAAAAGERMDPRATRALAAARAAAYNSLYMAKKAEDAAPSFEQGLKELEGIVKELETGDLALEKSLELFEKGVKLSEACRKQLQEAETKVEILLKKEGKIEAEPFDLRDGEGEA